MERIIEIRDHGGEKNRSERIITEGVGCYYKNSVSFGIRNCANFYYKLWQLIYCKVLQEQQLYCKMTSISIREVYYRKGYPSIFDSFDNIF